MLNSLVVRPGHQEDISELVEVTRKTVKERLQGDAWIMWAIAQRANLPLKIEACITYVSFNLFQSPLKLIHVYCCFAGQKGHEWYVPMSLAPYLFNSTLGYTRSLAGGSQKLLRDCLMEIHKDVITCWNFKGKVLNHGRSRLSLLDLRPRRQILYGEEFMQLMLHLVQDVINGSQPQDSAYVLT